MNELFRAVTERLKAVFTAHTAVELEADLTSRHVERKAGLLRQAAQLEAEGMAELAQALRRAAARWAPSGRAAGLLPPLCNRAAETPGLTPAHVPGPQGKTADIAPAEGPGRKKRGPQG